MDLQVPAERADARGNPLQRIEPGTAGNGGAEARAADPGGVEGGGSSSAMSGAISATPSARPWLAPMAASVTRLSVPWTLACTSTPRARPSVSSTRSQPCTVAVGGVEPRAAP